MPKHRSRDCKPRTAPHAAGAALVADCAYCGTRAVVRFEPGRTLACPACAAPYGALQHAGPAWPRGVNGARARHRPERPRDSAPDTERKRKKKKKKSALHWVLDEAWDALDDLFD